MQKKKNFQITSITFMTNMKIISAIILIIQKKMKITIIAGARPNFMKIAPLMRAINAAALAGHSISARLVYTGASSDQGLEPTLFTELGINPPQVYLGVDSKNFFERTAGILVRFSEELSTNPADLVVVVDDFTPTMACSIVAKKKGVKIAHLVAGIRSFDMDMPKEVNRMITDGLSDFLFTAGMDANRNLNLTGTEQNKVYFVGNILIDNLRNNLHRFVKPVIFKILGLQEKNYILLTLNRHTLLDETLKLKELILTILNNKRKMPVVCPAHSYVEKKIRSLQLASDNLYMLPSQPYLSFGYLEKNAFGIVTDSGNIAEEATFLGIPCITLNTYTEHAETTTVGTNTLVGENVSALSSAMNRMMNDEWQQSELPERWDGRTSERIVQILLENKK